MIDLLRMVPLFRRHVIERTHDLMRARQREAGPRRPHQLRQAEVGDAHPAALIHQDILRLHIAVNDAFFVRHIAKRRKPAE